MNKYKLTIAILTMNRAEQLKNAISSCLDSCLPENTQFVVVDNASNDNTSEIVKEIKKTIKYDLVYQKEKINRGVGGGRNICFDLAEGEYVYFLDDDAEIALACRPSFFVKSISYLDRNACVATLTTHIIDKVYGERILRYSKSMSVDSLPCVYTFQGGSVFVRRSSFKSPMFMDIMYGNEEIAVAMGALDKGLQNVYDESIYINHLPKVNKWIQGEMDEINVRGASNIFAIKTILYPVLLYPALLTAYKMRIRKYRLKDKTLLKTYRKKRKTFCKENKLRKVKLLTVIKAYKEYGLTTF